MPGRWFWPSRADSRLSGRWLEMIGYGSVMQLDVPLKWRAAAGLDRVANALSWSAVQVSRLADRLHPVEPWECKPVPCGPWENINLDGIYQCVDGHAVRVDNGNPVTPLLDPRPSDLPLPDPNHWTADQRVDGAFRVDL